MRVPAHDAHVVDRAVRADALVLTDGQLAVGVLEVLVVIGGDQAVRRRVARAGLVVVDLVRLARRAGGFFRFLSSSLAGVVSGGSHTGEATICDQTRGPTGDSLYLHITVSPTCSLRQPPMVVP